MKTMTVDVLDWEKKKCGEIQLNSDVFKEDVRLDIMSELVRAGQAAKRQGSHHAKTRAEVRGGGAKPFRQKGTGRARQGSSRSPLLRAGGVIHGPKPRKYFKKMTSKVKKLGIRSSLSHLLSKSSFVVVKDMASKEGKTKELNQKLKKFSSQALLVDHEKNLLFSRACKNLPRYQLLEVQGLNVYDLLKYEYVICTQSAVKKIHAVYGLDSRLRRSREIQQSRETAGQEYKSGKRNKSEAVRASAEADGQKKESKAVKSQPKLPSQKSHPKPLNQKLGEGSEKEDNRGKKQ